MLLICLLVICLVAFGFGLYFWIRYNGTFAKKLALWAALASILIGGTSALTKEICETNAENLIAAYEELVMYKQTVSNSSNEYIRNHYYNEVQEYNENYQKSFDKNSSIWYNIFYPDNIFERISTIEFHLRGDDIVDLPDSF